MTHDEMLDTVAALALGTLGEAERDASLAHLKVCAECRTEYAQLRPVAGLAAVAAEARADQLDEMTARRMRAATLRALATPAPASNAPQAQPAAPARSRSTALAYLAAVAAVVFALVTSINNAALRTQHTADHERIAEMQRALSAKARADEYDRAALADIFSSDSEHYQVKGGEVIRRGDKVYLSMWALPALPRGRVYQAWIKDSGKSGMEPSVTFVPNRKGFAIVRLPVDGSKVEIVALSIEPEGGSKAPTSTPTFVQKVA